MAFCPAPVKKLRSSVTSDVNLSWKQLTLSPESPSPRPRRWWGDCPAVSGGYATQNTDTCIRWPTCFFTSGFILVQRSYMTSVKHSYTETPAGRIVMIRESCNHSPGGSMWMYGNWLLIDLSEKQWITGVFSTVWRLRLNCTHDLCSVSHHVCSFLQIRVFGVWHPYETQKHSMQASDSLWTRLHFFSYIKRGLFPTKHLIWATPTSRPVLPSHLPWCHLPCCHVFYPLEHDLYRGILLKSDLASFGLVLSSNWAGFAVKTWQPCFQTSVAKSAVSPQNLATLSNPNNVIFSP